MNCFPSKKFFSSYLFSNKQKFQVSMLLFLLFLTMLNYLIFCFLERILKLYVSP